MQLVKVKPNVRKGTTVKKANGKSGGVRSVNYDVHYKTVQRNINPKDNTSEKVNKGIFLFSRKFMQTLGIDGSQGFDILAPENADLTTNKIVKLVLVNAENADIFGATKSKAEGAKKANVFTSNVVEETLNNAGIIEKGVNSFITVIKSENGSYFEFASVVSEPASVDAEL